MAIAVKGLIIISLGLLLIMNMMDIYINNQMIEDNFGTVRSANYNSLSEIKDDEVITDIKMLNLWLMNFAEASNTNFNELKISFLSLDSDPLYYVVYIEGTNNYCLISDDLHSRFTNAATVIETPVE